MTTAADIVNDAALAAGIGDQYNALDATSSGIGLRTLNRLLDSWSNESMMVFNVVTDSFVMTPGTSVYSTSLLSARPIEVNNVFVRLSGVDYPVELIGAGDYSKIGYKTTQGLPAQCKFDSGMPNGAFTFFPVPSAAYTCFVLYRSPLTQLASLATVLSLPPGYETALVYGVATMLAPLFGTEPTPTCIFHAKNAKEKIKPPNWPIDEVELGVPLGRGMFNIFSGN
jgi:hypothetical protein